MTFDPVGEREIAERLGKKRDTVKSWAKRGQLPPAEATVSGGPCWNWPTIEAWYASRVDRRKKPPSS